MFRLQFRARRSEVYFKRCTDFASLTESKLVPTLWRCARTTPGSATQADGLVELRAARPQLPMSLRLPVPNEVDSSGRPAQQVRMRPLETSRGQSSKPCASEVHGSGAVVGHVEDTILMDSGGCHGTVQE